MPMSDYIRDLRAKIGTTVLEIPTVSILTFDAAQRVLLVRHVEGNNWTTPGGMIEPHEVPADAAVREMWEETGLHVELTRVIGVFGGEHCHHTYRNGDRVAWISTTFAARAIGGVLAPDNDETLEVRYVSRDELAALPHKPHVPMMLAASFEQETYFQRPTWSPPA